MEQVHADPLHNDDIPCCRPLEEIAQAILSNWGAGHKDTNNNSNEKNSTIDNSATTSAAGAVVDTSSFVVFPESKGFLELIQDFLWQQHRRREQQLLEQEQAVTKKKRKKKKKKKGKSDGNNNGEIGEAATNADGDNPQTAESMEWTPSTDSENVISSTEQTIRDSNRKPTGEQDKIPLENNRDRWITCYLNRSMDPASHNRQAASDKALLIHEFLAFLAPKIPQHRGTDDTNDSANNSIGNHGGIDVNGTAQRPSHGATRRATRQPPPNRQQKDSNEASIHIYRKDLDKKVGDIECFACGTRVKSFLASSSGIPLQNVNEMMARAIEGGRDGGGRRNRLDGLNADGVANGDHPFDYVAMEEGNAGPWDSTENSGLQQQQQQQGGRLILQAIKSSGDGEIIGWQLQKQQQKIDQTVPSTADSGTTDRRPAQKQQQLQQQQQQQLLDHPNQLQSETQHLTEEDFFFLIREFFFLSAISYDKLVGACDMEVLSSEKVKTITELVEGRYSTILAELTECMKELLKQQEILVSYECKTGDYMGPQTDDGIDIKSPVLLNDSESAISGVLGKLLRIVLQVTHAYQEIMLQWNGTFAEAISSSDDQNHQQRRSAFGLQSPSLLLGQVAATESLWQQYVNAFSKVLDETAAFERDLFQLADRQGSLKLFFLCPRSRQLQAKLVQAKLKIVLFAVEDIRKQLDEKCDSYETPFKVYRPTFLRSILTQQVLLQVVRTSTAHGKQIAETTRSLTSELSTLNDACEDVVHEIRQSWTETIRQQNMSQFQEAYAIKVDKLGRLLRTAHTLLDHQQQEQQPVGNGIIDDSEDAGVANFLQRISEYSQMSGDVLSVFRSQIVPAVNSMIRRWLILSTAAPTEKKAISSPGHAVANGSAEPLIMPLRLIRWMSSERPCNLRAPYLRCPGADGSIRATCLIMALLFRWFVKQYNEWQAVLAERELLMIMSKNDTFASNDPAVGVEASQTETGKKKSKRKKGKSATSVSVDLKSKQKDSAAAGFTPDKRTLEQSEKKQAVPPDNEDDSDQSTQSVEPASTSKLDPCISSESVREQSSTSATVAATHNSPDAFRTETQGELSGVSQTEATKSDAEQEEIACAIHEQLTTLPNAEKMVEDPMAAPTESMRTDASDLQEEVGVQGNGKNTYLVRGEREVPATKLLSSPRPFIGVMDGTTAIPVHEFLLGRLLNTVKCANDYGRPIVNL